MLSLDQLRLPGLDPADPDLKGRRWHRRVDDLVESGHWLARAPQAVVVLDREAGEFFLRSEAAVFPGRELAERSGLGPGPLREQIELNLVNLEGEAHRRLRGLLNPGLSPQAANRWRPGFDRILTDLWDELPGERFDFVACFARPYATLAMTRILGVPELDAPRLREWSGRFRGQYEAGALADPESVAAIQRETERFRDWIEPIVAARREEPGEDLISTLIRTEEDGGRLTGREVESLVLNLLVAGVDTVQNQLAHGVRLLATDPESWTALRADPETLVPRAVGEILRFEPVIAFTARQLAAEIEYRDVLFPAGTPLLVCLPAGNRDPGRFEHPFEFGPLRDRDRARSLSFGTGIHHCAGASFARAELEQALHCLTSRCERIELADEPDLQPVAGLYGVDTLELRVTPA